MICVQDLDKNVIDWFPNLKMFVRGRDDVPHNSYNFIRKKIMKEPGKTVKYKRYLLTYLPPKYRRRINKEKGKVIENLRNKIEFKI